MRQRIRTLKPETWKDKKVGDLSYGARNLRTGMITSADDEGRFLALTSTLVADIFPFDAEDATVNMPAWVSEIRKSGMVVFYKAAGVPYGAFRNWAEHQRINRPSPSDLPPPPDKRVVWENGLIEVPTDKGIVWRQRRVAAPETLTDYSVNSHGEDGETSGSSQSPRASAPIRSDPDPVVVELTERLAAGVRANDPKFDTAKATGKTWLTDMRLLLADRGGDADEVRRVIDFCVTDSFERKNVLSPGKLRARFTALLIKANEVSGPGLRLVSETPDNPYDRAVEAKMRGAA